MPASAIEGPGIHAVVGLALLPKKAPRVLEQPGLKRLAEAAGLQLVAVDPHAPLHSQWRCSARPRRAAQQERNDAASLAQPGAHTGGQCQERQGSLGPPFDLIVHKLHNDSVWEAHLAAYLAAHPHVRAIDPPTAIHATEDRALMLAAIPPHGLELTLPPPAAPPPPAAAAASPALVQDTYLAAAAQAPDPLSCWALLTDSEQEDCHVDALATGATYGGHGTTRGGPEATCDGLGTDPWVATEVAPSSAAHVHASAPSASAASVAGAAAAAAAPASAVDRVRVLAPAQAVVRSRGELRALAASCGGSASNPLQPPLLLKTQRADAAGGSGHGLAVALSWGRLEAAAEALQASAAPAAASSRNAAAAGDACGAARSGGRPRGSEQGGGTGGSDGDGGGGGCGGGGGGGGGGWVPLVVQQYVPHTDSLYKVYVLGRRVHIQRRASLTLQRMRQLDQQQQQEHEREQQAEAHPQQESHHADQQGQISDETRRKASAGGGITGGGGGVAPLLQHLSATPQVAPQAVRAGLGSRTGSGLQGPATAQPPNSSAPSEKEQEEEVKEDGEEGEMEEEADLQRALHAAAGALARRMGLSMFNFDAVVPAAAPPPTLEEKEGSTVRLRQLYVVDVNYFPGYDKLPGWEAALVEHLSAEAGRSAAARLAATATVAKCVVESGSGIGQEHTPAANCCAAGAK